jgi:hypothetical protein
MISKLIKRVEGLSIENPTIVAEPKQVRELGERAS